jgi:hypothetical protein
MLPLHKAEKHILLQPFWLLMLKLFSYLVVQNMEESYDTE